MRKTLSITLAIATLCLVPLVGTAPSAKAGEICVLDDSSFGMICDFYTMGQCRASASGRSGTCGRDPFLNMSAANVYAYAPRAFNATGRKWIKK